MDVVDEVRDKLSIEQVVGQVVGLKKSGSAYKGLCPFHNERTPSFYVTPSRGMYKCFSCGEGGDIFSFVMKTRNMGFRDALHVLADQAGVTVEETPREGPSLAGQYYEMNAAAATYFQSMLAAPAGTSTRAYLEGRALTAATIDRFGLGYAPDTRDALCARLRTAGYADDAIVAAGLATAPEDGGPIRDYFRGRVIFPIRDEKGRVLGFGGRVLGEGQPKYLNTRATAVFEKSRVLYTIEYASGAMRGAREGVIVEGYMDALRAHQEGFANVVATLGTSITESQLRALARYAPRLVLALDADPAGQKAAVKAGLAALGARSRAQTAAGAGQTAPQQLQVMVATLPAGLDPDDAIRADPTQWKRAVETAAPLMEHYFSLVEQGLDRSGPEWRQEAVDTLLPAIGQLDGVGLQQSYIEKLSALTGVDARYLRDKVGGGPAGATNTPRGRRAAIPAAAPAPVAATDPLRVVEEYLVGLLLLHRPLAADVRAETTQYAVSSPNLSALLDAARQDAPLDAAQEELAEALMEPVRRAPIVSSYTLAATARVCMTRANEIRARRDVLELGRVLMDVDQETARTMGQRTDEMLVMQKQQTARLVREQEGQHRYRAGSILGEPPL